MSRDIMLLIGQSNMAGRGLPNEVDPIADGRIETFRDSQWQTAVEPLHDDKPHDYVRLIAPTII